MLAALASDVSTPEFLAGGSEKGCCVCLWHGGELCAAVCDFQGCVPLLLQLFALPRLGSCVCSRRCSCLRCPVGKLYGCVVLAIDAVVWPWHDLLLRPAGCSLRGVVCMTLLLLLLPLLGCIQMLLLAYA